MIILMLFVRRNLRLKTIQMLQNWLIIVMCVCVGGCVFGRNIP